MSSAQVLIEHLSRCEYIYLETRWGRFFGEEVEVRLWEWVQSGRFWPWPPPRPPSCPPPRPPPLPSPHLMGERGGKWGCESGFGQADLGGSFEEASPELESNTIHSKPTPPISRWRWWGKRWKVANIKEGELWVLPKDTFVPAVIIIWYMIIYMIIHICWEEGAKIERKKITDDQL